MLLSSASFTAWLLLGLLTLDPGSRHVLVGTFRVRPLRPVLCHTLIESYSQSSTFRDLVDELEKSDVIVHVVHGPPHMSPSAFLQFIAGRAGVRFLRITLDETLRPSVRAAMLGHELQHAVEVARASWVVDAPTFAALYRDIGRSLGRNGPAEQFETDAARHVQLRVLTELDAARSRRRASTR